MLKLSRGMNPILSEMKMSRHCENANWIAPNIDGKSINVIPSCKLGLTGKLWKRKQGSISARIHLFE